jgi:hypothetical protein
MDFVTKQLQLSMPKAAWKILGMYVAVLTHEQLKAKEPKLNWSRVVGGIVMRHVIVHREWIEQKFVAVYQELLCVGTLPRFFSREQIEAIAASDGGDIRFESGVDELLQELVNGTKKFSELDQPERDLLNRATVDLATAKRPSPDADHASRPQARERLPAAARAAMGDFDDDEPELEWGAEGRHARVVDLPEAPPTFWWRKPTSSE